MKYLISACFFILVLSLVVVGYNASDFRNGFIRLHILADSDNADAQALKLELRDEVINKYGNELSSLSLKSDAEAYIVALIPEIEKMCDDFLANKGVNYGSHVEYCREYYDNRVYENFTLPAGRYSSLKINLGSSEGKNWWCVLFPPLCLDAASEPNDEYIVNGLSHDEYRVIDNGRKGKFIIKFKLFEIMGKLFK